MLWLGNREEEEEGCVVHGVIVSFFCFALLIYGLANLLLRYHIWNPYTVDTQKKPGRG